MIFSTRLLLSATILCSLSALVTAQSYSPVLSINPAHPNPGDTIVATLFFPIGGCTSAGTVDLSQVGHSLKILHTIPGSASVAAGMCSKTFEIGSLPIGRYSLEWDDLILTSPPQNITRGTLNFLVGDGGPPIPIPTINGLNLLALLASALLGSALILIRRGENRKM